jgi:hypothetical protein
MMRSRAESAVSSGASHAATTSQAEASDAPVVRLNRETIARAAASTAIAARARAERSPSGAAPSMRCAPIIRSSISIGRTQCAPTASP